eukprot:gb/GEZN01012010.1/.p1 GENE.gb/GEZN01012010.1/~~gb/GEZN01012010.1/.p1  ORF type:complete len:184 (+),score=33.88 gb/GEZN01012010.1/:146-697(+)
MSRLVLFGRQASRTCIATPSLTFVRKLLVSGGERRGDEFAAGDLVRVDGKDCKIANVMRHVMQQRAPVLTWVLQDLETKGKKQYKIKNNQKYEMLVKQTPTAQQTEDAQDSVPGDPHLFMYRDKQTLVFGHATTFEQVECSLELLPDLDSRPLEDGEEVWIDRGEGNEVKAIHRKKIDKQTGG